MQLTLLEAEMLSVIDTVLHECTSAEPPSDPNSYLPPRLIEAMQRVVAKAMAPAPQRMEQTT
jgi:hypothetical protein